MHQKSIKRSGQIMFVSFFPTITSNKNDTGPSLRTLAVAEALSAQQNLDQAVEAAATAAIGFKAGHKCEFLAFRNAGGSGFIREYKKYKYKYIYIHICIYFYIYIYDDMPFFGGVSRDGRVACFGSETADVHGLFHSSTQGFFQHNACASVTPKNHDLSLFVSLSLSLARAFWVNLSIHPSIYTSIYASIHLIYLPVYLSIYLCVSCIIFRCRDRDRLNSFYRLIHAHMHTAAWMADPYPVVAPTGRWWLDILCGDTYS